MKLKYYLRGVGIGVIVTTLIFMISISIHKDDTAAKDTDAGQDIGQTVAEANKMNTESAEPTETELETETPTADTQMQSSEQESETVLSTEPPAAPNAADSALPTAPEAADAGSDPAQSQTTSFTVGKGEYSDSIAQRLAELALVDNADAFNKFLIEKNYDNFILPGTYTIPLDSTYEEIAALLTTKAANP